MRRILAPAILAVALACALAAPTLAAKPERKTLEDLERAGVIETRRGVGSFVNGTAARAHPPREHDRRLRAFTTRMLAEADAAGFTADDLIAALKEM